MRDILQEIAAEKRRHVERMRAEVPVEKLRKMPYYGRQGLDFNAYVCSPERNGVIAEFKRKSPSKGVINSHSTVADVTAGYARAGASAISILTDGPFFGGSNEDILAVRGALDVPVLRKDFIVDVYQLEEAKAIGADVILLIAAMLPAQEIKMLAAAAKDLGLNVLLEVHNREELEVTLCDKIDAVGVNNRDLKTFKVDIQTAAALAGYIPEGLVKIAESGLQGAAEVQTLKRAGYQGFLIGESFMNTNDPAAALAKLADEIKE